MIIHYFNHSLVNPSLWLDSAFSHIDPSHVYQTPIVNQSRLDPLVFAYSPSKVDCPT